LDQERIVTTWINARMWRLGAAIAPFIALALSLEAGRRW